MTAINRGVGATAGLARRRPRFKRPSGWHIFLAPTAFIFLVPFIQMFLAALSPAKDLVKYPTPFFPSHLTIQGFVSLFRSSDILLWLGNTTIVSIAAIVSHLVLCSLAGYGFARLKFRGSTFGFFAIVSTIMIPTQLLMIPTYIMFADLGLIDTLGAAIVPWLATAFGIFLMRQFFLSLPAELEEAALLDGCSQWGVFFRIVLPLARPALATLAIFTLLGAWNDLVWPLISINNEHIYTLQLGISDFQSDRRTQWSLLMAGNVIATTPLILFFLVAQRQFVATMTFSGLKG